MHSPILVGSRGKSIALALSLMLLSGCRATTYDDALNFRHQGDQTLYRAALRSAAGRDDVQAMVVLAGELAATPEADELLARAERLGSQEAAGIRVWQIMFEGGWATNPDSYHDEALRRIRRAAELGDPESMIYLALTHLEQGGTQNLEHAERLLSLAGKSQCEAHLYLASLWLDGQVGHQADTEIGRHHLEQAATHGCLDGHALLAKAISEGRVPASAPLDAALHETRKAPDGTCGHCRLVAGDILARKADWPGAVSEWTKAAESGDRRAATRLADAALEGRLTSPDARLTALGWLAAADLPSERPGPRTAALAATMPEQQVAAARRWAENYFSQHFALPYDEDRLWQGQRAVLRLR